MNQNHSILHALYKQDDVVKMNVSRFLLLQILLFHGHDEKKYSASKGNFLELVKYIGEQNDVVNKVILENAPKITRCTEIYVEEIYVEEIHHGIFGLLVDESADVSDKEQMTVVFQFVDKSGSETYSLSLISAIDGLFAKYAGCGGNYEIHTDIGSFFYMVSMLLNVVCKRKYKFLDINRNSVEKRIDICLRSKRSKRCQAYGLLKYFHTFDCVFCMQIMLLILGLTGNLSMALQKQNQDISNAMSLVNSDLLISIASLSHVDSFGEFDKSKLMRLVKFYPDGFSFGDHLSIEHQLEIYIDIHLAHPLVYGLLKLVLTLSVATASVERCFSAMKLVKTTTRNRIGDEFLSDCLVCYIEKEFYKYVTNETVVKRFQSLRECRVHF
ncbi:hypothetical protein EUTSA_v10012171mg [Eutrema salsugineum]|uniref:HAT C-terminal dimerisation domain-containing protein n=1 Tax=Eutrema salsugineum TaxID=72664 RepID=V4JZC1_EUTSA|nr:hypothetical protein EUTSA_v10012171mg [Eutrema salsugineum]